VSNHVLGHALEVDVNIAKLKEAVAKTSAAHQRDVRNETEAKTKLELAYAAYAELTTAMKELAASTVNSLKPAVAAKKALKDYKDKEQRETRRARQHASLG
jgi:hypothetical protein